MNRALWALMLTAAAVAGAPSAAEDKQLAEWNAVAQAQLARRGEQIAAIRTPEQIAERKQYVRTKFLELMGGLPTLKSPLNARIVKSLDRGSFRVEALTFESFPNYLVTANVYAPKTAGKHPAVLMPMGHWESGKGSGQLLASNLAMKGFVVLAYDPVGQGERQQAYDPRLGRSLIGGPTEQHFMNGAQSVLLGQSFTRYAIWDGIRALDYLSSRADVDADRIGCTGCSGGGTLTTFISALDSRVKVAAPACYMNSFRTLYIGAVGDSEQSLPGFISSGLDQTDLVELFAPKPWLMASTEGDFFTPAGAKQVFDEARNWYEMQGSQGNIKWVVGPGGHGTPLPVREAIYDWMIRWLQEGRGDDKEQQVDLVPDYALWATPKGQVGGRELYEVIRETPTSRRSIEELRKFVRDLLDANPAADTPVVSAPARTYSGNWLGNTRAWLIGHNLPAMHANTLRAHVVGNTYRLEAEGVAGVWALLAAVADPRITEVALSRTPYSYAAALSSPVHMNMHDAVIPGFALHWDLQDLVTAIAPRKVTWTDPVDWMGNVVPLGPPYLYTSSDPNGKR